MSIFTKVTNKTLILKELRRYLGFGSDFIAGVSAYGGKFYYEGVRTLSIVTNHREEVRITLTNSDSKYQSSIASIFLDDIDYIELL